MMSPSVTVGPRTARSVAKSYLTLYRFYCASVSSEKAVIPSRAKNPSTAKLARKNSKLSELALETALQTCLGTSAPKETTIKGRILHIRLAAAFNPGQGPRDVIRARCDELMSIIARSWHSIPSLPCPSRHSSLHRMGSLSRCQPLRHGPD
jgi:hypothetical protein